MRKKKAEIIIVTILWIYVIISMIYNPHFRIQSFFGIISLTFVSTALVLKKDDLSLGVLVFSLTLSTFDAIKYGDAFDARIGIFHLFPLILLIVLIFTRFSELMDLKEKWFGGEPEELEKAKENKIALFTREFKNLSSEELIKRENTNNLVEEAKIAISQILKERNVTIDKK
ncbi:MAG: hypothetical protein O9267_13780 [Flavobacterium sp.]|uniref:hypothetical protein n=1 Tax=Flavobacterium sp. TaxID=239 RepID=UPI0022CB01EA|nr:hypothetical protein [Flavobacterium sp.]MCZ8198669.1 hypothetical protein [Flavobacterium sp.]